jgi:hypothetical protein
VPIASSSAFNCSRVPSRALRSAIHLGLLAIEPGFTRFIVAVESYLNFRDAITRVVLGRVSMGNFCSGDDVLCGGGAGEAAGCGGSGSEAGSKITVETPCLVF